MPQNDIYTVDELISAIKHSDLPTILVEGPFDVLIVKKWQKQFRFYVSILPTSGKPSLLDIYLRRHEFDDKKVIFLADKDMWRFEPIPPQFSEIIFTQGYCIENDLFSNSDVMRLLTPQELSSFERLIGIIGRWFAFQLEIHRSGQLTTCESHINEICDFNIQDICQTYRQRHRYSEPRLNTINEIMANYELNIRGKQLFQALARFLNAPGRTTRYNENTLIELCALEDDNNNVKNLISQMASKLWGLNN